jgi:hypothetical protein
MYGEMYTDTAATPNIAPASDATLTVSVSSCCSRLALRGGRRCALQRLIRGPVSLRSSKETLQTK